VAGESEAIVVAIWRSSRCCGTVLGAPSNAAGGRSSPKIEKMPYLSAVSASMRLAASASAISDSLVGSGVTPSVR